jgi:hypothetical protein
MISNHDVTVANISTPNVFRHTPFEHETTTDSTDERSGDARAIDPECQPFRRSLVHRFWVETFPRWFLRGERNRIGGESLSGSTSNLPTGAASSRNGVTHSCSSPY